MRIAMIGTGYVGLVSGVCFSDFGHEVVCIDKDARKIDMLKTGEVPIFEPGLDILLAKNTKFAFDFYRSIFTDSSGYKDKKVHCWRNERTKEPEYPSFRS